MKTAFAVAEEQTHVGRLSIGHDYIEVVVAIEIADADIARRVPGGEGRTGRKMKVSCTVPEKHRERAWTRICYDDISLAIMIQVRDGDGLGIRVRSEHDLHKLRAGGRCRAPQPSCES